MIEGFAVYAAIAVVVLVALIGLVVRKRRRKSLDIEGYQVRWKDLQKHCATRKTWPLAVIEADNLLDDALRASRYKGKTTGERLVAAQRRLSNNESVWFGHKLRNRIVHEDVRKLKKQEILESLSGFRQALRDLGALPPMQHEVLPKQDEVSND